MPRGKSGSGDKVINTPEVKRDRFLRVGVKRVRKAVKAVKLLSNLANTATYNYTQADTQKMLVTLHEALAYVELAFSRQEAPEEEGFSF